MENTFTQNLHLQWAPIVSDINWIKNSTSKGLRLCYGKFHDVISPTFMDSNGLHNMYVTYLLALQWIEYDLQWTPMVSNDMAETSTNSTSPTPLDSNGLCHTSKYYFDLSRDFYYKTPTKMDSKGLQQFIWKVRSFKISISNGLQQSQTLIE